MKRGKKTIKHSLITTILVVAAILTGLGIMYSFSRSMSISQQSACVGSCVALQADKALPDTLTISAGSYVQFNSADGKSHNLSIGKGGENHEHSGKFYSGEFKADEGWRVQFNEEGTYFFHDHLNPKINVLVVVYKPGKEYKL